MWYRRKKAEAHLAEPGSTPAGPHETALPRLRQPNLRHPLPQMFGGPPTRTQHSNRPGYANQRGGGHSTGGVGRLLEGHPRNSNRLPSLR
jgi:hypothetical protein